MADLFDEYDYIAYPITIVGLADQLKKVIDDYRARELTNSEVKEIILFYAENNNKKLFDRSDYNITIKRRLGKKRLDIVKTLLNGYQHRM